MNRFRFTDHHAGDLTAAVFGGAGGDDTNEGDDSALGRFNIGRIEEQLEGWRP